MHLGTRLSSGLVGCFVICLVFAAPAFSDQFTATWICTDSSFHVWTDPACWDLGGSDFPDNTPSDNYDAIVDANLGWNSKVYLDGSPWIDLDNLEVGGGDVIRVDSGYLSVYDDGPETGTVTNHGEIQLNSQGGFVDFYFGPDLEISGIGEFFMTGHLNNRFNGIYSGTLTNVSGHTIRGGGSLTGSMIIDNEGIIDADLDGFQLKVRPRTSDSSTNEGSLRASYGGNLVLEQGTWDNSGGTILARNSGVVTIVNASVIGGQVTATQGGVVELDHHLEDASVSGTLRIFNATMAGTIYNQGTIHLDENPGYWVRLNLNADTEFTGGGDIELFPSVFVELKGTSGPHRLTNGMNHTIKGGGVVGEDTLAFTNRGFIVANEPDLQMTLHGVDSLTNLNDNHLRATNEATLLLKSTTWENSSGIVEALDGSLVDIFQSTVNGGLLRTVGSGEIGLRWQSHLDGVLNQGYLHANSNGSVDTTYLHGIIDNDGTIEINNMHLVCDGLYRPSWQSTTLLQPTAFFELSNTTEMEGTLAGEGRFEGNLELKHNAWLDPGLPTGTLRTYDLTIESGARYLWQVDADGPDLVNVEGTLDFGVAFLYVTPEVIGVDTPQDIVLFEYDQLPVIPDTDHIVLGGGLEYQSISIDNNRITLIGVDVDPEIFADGFEDGTTGEWSTVVR